MRIYKYFQKLAGLTEDERNRLCKEYPYELSFYTARLPHTVRHGYDPNGPSSHP